MRSLLAACAALVMSCGLVPHDFGEAGPGVVLGGNGVQHGTGSTSDGGFEDGGFFNDGGFFIDGGAFSDGGLFIDGGFVGSGLACAVTPPDAGFAFFSPCPPDEYCQSPNCQSGVCVRKPTGAIPNNRNLQCGCDRVTYWNPDVAAAAGASVAFAGECLATVECGGINNRHCAAPAVCNLRQFSMNECNISDPLGTCWALPPSCPPASVNITSHSCALTICIDECSIIRQGQLWYQDPTCSTFTP